MYINLLLALLTQESTLMAAPVAPKFHPPLRALFNTRKRNAIPEALRASFNRLEIRNSWHLSGVLSGRKDAEGEDEDAGGERTKFPCRIEHGAFKVARRLVINCHRVGSR